MSELRDYQHKAIEGLRDSLRAGKRRPMLQAPTGAGKTKIASAVVLNALEKGKRIAFTVPALSLIDQTTRAFWDDGIEEVGVQQGNHPLYRPNAPVQVCSVQTLERRELPPVDIVIVDEAHILRARIWEWMAERPSVPFVGLSATPWAKGLGLRYDDLVIAATTGELIDRGYLASFKVYAPSHPDLTGVRTKGGDWHEGDLSALVAKGDKALVGDVVKTWLELGQNRQTVCFAVDRRHADILCEQFNLAGVAAEYVDCFTSRDARDLIRIRFHTGQTKVVCNVDTLGIGVDWDIRCVVLARPHKSEMAYVQKIGRGLRTADGKDHCLILDHSDTTLRLGFVTDIFHDELDDGKPKRKGEARERLPRPCSQCGYLIPVGIWTCPGCGHEATPETKARWIEGRLGEISRQDRPTATLEEKAIWYSQLLGYSRSRNWKDGWAAYKFREKFGMWPVNFKGITPTRPGLEVMNWITSRNIAWARSRRRAQANDRPIQQGDAF